MANFLNEFSMDFFRLDGKVAIVTGGNTGLGQAYAAALAKAGADLVITTHGTNWSETKELIENMGRKVVFVQADLTKKEDRQNIIEVSMKEFGKIDILVNNAGTIKRAPLLEYDEEDWNAVMDINLNAVYFLSQEAAKIPRAARKIV